MNQGNIDDAQSCSRLRQRPSVWWWGPIAICVASAVGHAADGATAAQPVATVETTAVVRKSIEDKLTVYGQVQADPDSITSLTPPRAGLVTQVAVRLGQRVSAGEKVLSLDTAPDTRAQYLQAKAAVDYAQSELARIERLRQEQLATREQVQAAQRSLSDAQAQLESLRQVGADEASAVFRSPFAGVVTAVNVGQGERVQANTAVVLLARQDQLIGVLGIEPEDAKLVAPGSDVTLTSVFDPGVRFDGKVSKVHALINPATRLVDVVVTIPSPQASALTLNSTVRAQIALQSQELLVIPRQALRYDGTQAFVFRVHQDHAERVDVTVDKVEGAQIGVSGDLAPDDSVIATGSYQVRDGMAVRAPSR